MKQMQANIVKFNDDWLVLVIMSNKKGAPTVEIDGVYKEQRKAQQVAYFKNWLFRRTREELIKIKKEVFGHAPDKI